jgi:carboxylesterase type B
MAHCEDLPYWFASPDCVPYLFADDDDMTHTVVQTMSDSLATFARTNDPSYDAIQ